MIKTRNYSFSTIFVVKAPVETVWSALSEFEGYGIWWKGVSNISVDRSVSSPVASMTVKYLFHRLSLVFNIYNLVENELCEFTAKGDLVGNGKFIVNKVKNGTKVCIVWQVVTVRVWMNIFAPILRPFFVFSHEKIMRWFVTGFADNLHAELLYAEYK
ncbi:MAG: SRPBCC family protein [Bacteroidota bacterium]